MIVRMQAEASPGEIDGVQRWLDPEGTRSRIVDNAVVLTCGGAKEADATGVETLPGVARVDAIDAPYRLVHRSLRPEGTRIRIGDFEVGGNDFVVAAGPCAVENEAQLMRTAMAVRAGGARILRGGAFKPRTSPYSFRGLAKEGLRLLARAGKAFGMAVVTEVLDLEDVELVADHADILQIGARNMQNYALLETVGRTGKPVLLKRGLSARVEEWLLAAEYIALQGNLNIILCERGIRTFETSTRNTLDLASAVLLREKTHLPVFVDPSHATGRWELVGPLSGAAAATGIAGLIVEVHPEPRKALCDGSQSLTPKRFEQMMESVTLVLASQGRQLAGAPEPRRSLDAIILRLMEQRAGISDLPHAGAEEVFRDIIRGSREQQYGIGKVVSAHAAPRNDRYGRI